ncbi:Uncharacterized glycosyltransferase sll0501 [Gammaproteobacteria bacterium]
MSSSSANDPLPELSVVVPLLNEANNLELLYQRLSTVLEQEEVTFELIFVDDGSNDNSLAVIRQLRDQDPRIRYVSLSRNFGHEAASSCGLHRSRGKAVVLMDADLQDPPEVIPQMLTLWRQGNLVVNARRRSRLGETWFKKATSHLFYRIINLVSEVHILPDVGDFRLVDRTLIEVFKAMPEHNRFLRGMFSWIGFPQITIDFDRQERRSGYTKYNTLKLTLLSLEALSGFSIFPLRLCASLGLIIVMGCILATLAVVAHRLFFGLDLPGYTLLTAGTFLLGGTQLVFLGIIGEYVGKIYKQVQQRPLYVIKEEEKSG